MKWLFKKKKKKGCWNISVPHSGGRVTVSVSCEHCGGRGAGEVLQAAERWNDVRARCNFPGVLGRIPGLRLGSACTTADALLRTGAQTHKVHNRIVCFAIFRRAVIGCSSSSSYRCCWEKKRGGKKLNKSNCK